MILEIGSHTRSINQNINIKRLEQILRTNPTELQQARSIDRTRSNNNIRRRNEPSIVRRVATTQHHTSRRSAITLEDDLAAIVPDEQVQVGAVADRLIVSYSCGGAFACVAADGLRGPDEAGVVAVCSFDCVGGV
jgi:hypothetical protein